MLTKLNIVLFKPRLIGLFIKEKISRVILMLLLCVLITISPEIVKSAVNDGVSNEFRNYVKYVASDTQIEDTYINNYELSYNATTSFNVQLFDVVIGNIDDVDTLFSFTFNFKEKGIDFYVSGVSVYTATYQELDLQELDFSKISYDVIEVNRFLNVFDNVYNLNKPILVIYNSVYMFIDILFMVVLSAIMLAILTGIFRKTTLPFKFRFLTALNCQYIFLFFILLSVLYNALFLQMIGNIIMAVYVFKAINAISITVQRVE